MSDTQGENRPEESTPAVPSTEQPSAAEPTTALTGEHASAPAAEQVAPAPAAQPAPASAPQTPPPGWQGATQPPAVPVRPPYPGTYQGQAYGQPGYGQAPQQQYAGQPHPSYPQGQAFGAAATAANQTQPTVPLGAPALPTPTSDAPKKKSGAGMVVGLIVAAALVGGAAGLGGSYAGVNLWGGSSASPASGPATVTVNDTDSVNQTTAIAAKVTPSVVTIEASSGSSGGTGSGVVLTSDGYIATNTHVVTLDGATGDATIRVTTSDGKVYEAEVVGTDPTYDLAVIKLKDASGLTPIEFGDSSKLNVGDQSVAIGAPLGLSNSVTTGIVSALNRSIQIASSAAPDSGGSDSDQNGDNGDSGQSPFRFDFGQGEQQQSTPTSSISIAVIQTDAAINPGNSGGALVNGKGELIGINVAIASAGGTSEGSQSGNIGVGFSIPSNIVKRVTDEIVKDGKATHGLLGANVQSAAAVKGATITGAYIDAVSNGGAAASGGLQKGDIVTEFNGVPITDNSDLTAQVRAAAAGSKASVTYVRDGKNQTTDVTLGELTE